ncbi:hypothetical protein ACFWAD_24260 [Rhodococcus sp. NPDC059969]|uniref:hypothetical protein n=1 Tax=Rhodococcus sp. NPDC059969 TaxID=3347018 RepID=UPI0036714F06
MTTNLGTAHFTATAPRAATTLLSDFDSLYGTVRSAPDGSVVEQDVVFFGRPDPGALLTGSVRSLGSTLERITEYHDQTGHLVAEVFVREAPAVFVREAPTAGAGTDSVAALADFAARRYGSASLRRFRGRCTSTSVGTDLNCSVTVLATYEKDHESVTDVALVATDSAGVVTARAWATYAIDNAATLAS